MKNLSESGKIKHKKTKGEKKTPVETIELKKDNDEYGDDEETSEEGSHYKHYNETSRSKSSSDSLDDEEKM